MSTLRKLYLSLLVVGLVGSCAAFVTFSAFSSTTTNPGNTFDTGTVVVDDNDGGAAMYNVTGVSGGLPGQTTVKCIHVTYTGSLPADVKLYTPSTFDAGADYVDLKVEAGSGGGAFPDCTGFTPDGLPIYDGTLGDFAAHGDWDGGVPAYPAGKSEWDQNDAVTYQFTLSVKDDDDAMGHSIAAHAFTWEAQNQP